MQPYTELSRGGASWLPFSYLGRQSRDRSSYSIEPETAPDADPLCPVTPTPEAERRGPTATPTPRPRTPKYSTGDRPGDALPVPPFYVNRATKSLQMHDSSHQGDLLGPMHDALKKTGCVEMLAHEGVSPQRELPDIEWRPTRYRMEHPPASRDTQPRQH